jgi:hypothetical protein
MAQERMYGILRLMFDGIEVELGNDECNGHILSIWHMQNWFVALSCVWLRTLE